MKPRLLGTDTDITGTEVVWLVNSDGSDAKATLSAIKTYAVSGEDLIAITAEEVIEEIEAKTGTDRIGQESIKPASGTLNLDILSPDPPVDETTYGSIRVKNVSADAVTVELVADATSHTHTAAEVTDLDDAAGGILTGEGLQAVYDAGGADAAALGATISLLFGIGGAPAAIATAADLWTEAEGFKMVTAESMALANSLVTLTPSSNIIAIDGALFWNAISSIAAATTIGEADGLTAHPRRLTVLTDGSTRIVTPHASYKRVNFDDTVSVSANSGAVFVLWQDAAQALIALGGLYDA